MDPEWEPCRTTVPFVHNFTYRIKADYQSQRFPGYVLKDVQEDAAGKYIMSLLNCKVYLPALSIFDCDGFVFKEMPDVLFSTPIQYMSEANRPHPSIHKVDIENQSKPMTLTHIVFREVK